MRDSRNDRRWVRVAGLPRDIGNAVPGEWHAPLNDLTDTLLGYDDPSLENVCDREDVRRMGVDAWRLGAWPWSLARKYADGYEPNTSAMLVIMARVVHGAYAVAPNLVNNIVGGWCGEITGRDPSLLAGGRVVPIDYVWRN